MKSKQPAFGISLSLAKTTGQFISVYYYLTAALILMISAFLFITPAEAQTQTAAPTTVAPGSQAVPAVTVPAPGPSVPSVAAPAPSIKTPAQGSASAPGTVAAPASAQAPASVSAPAPAPAPVVAPVAPAGTAVAPATAPAAVTSPAAGTTASSAAQPAPIDKVEASATQDAAQDENVTYADLDAKQAAILPDNPLYGLKRFGRGLRKVLTFDNNKKIELEVKHASQELADAQNLLEKKGADSSAVAEIVAKSVDKVEASLAKVKEQAAGAAGQGGAQTAKAVENILDKQIKQQKVLENIEQKILEKAPEAVAAKVVERIQDAREKAAAHVGEAVARLEPDASRLAEHFDRALDGQRGSQFKDLRNLEVIKRVQEHVPDQAKDALKKVEDQAIARLAERVNELPAADRAQRFERYTKHMGGDMTRHLEIFDRMKASEGLPAAITEKIEAVKDIAAGKFKEQVEEFDKQFGDEAIRERMRARMFARFKEGGEGTPTVAKLRVMEDIRQRVDFDNEKIKQEFNKEQEAGITKFKESFTDTTSQDQAERFRKLSAQMAENPDPTTFRLLQQLETEVKADPAKAKLIEEMERGAKAKFAERAQKEGSKFFERVISSNPQDIEIFKQLKDEFQKSPEQFFMPPGLGPEGAGPPPFGPAGFAPRGLGPDGFGPPPFGPGGPPPGLAKIFDQVIQKHTEGLAAHLQGIQDPALFENFQKKFQQGPPDLAQEIQRRQADFGQLFQDKLRFINEQSVQQDVVDASTRQQLEGERQKIEQEFKQKLQEAGGNEEQRRLLEADRLRQDQALNERSLETQQQMFQKRTQSNPFCDERCQKEESQNFQSLIRERQQRMQELFQQPAINIPGFDQFGLPGQFPGRPDLPPGQAPSGQPTGVESRTQPAGPPLTTEEIESKKSELISKERTLKQELENKLYSAESEVEQKRLKAEFEEKKKEISDKKSELDRRSQPSQIAPSPASGQPPAFDRGIPSPRAFERVPFGPGEGLGSSRGVAPTPSSPDEAKVIGQEIQKQVQEQIFRQIGAPGASQPSAPGQPSGQTQTPTPPPSSGSQDRPNFFGGRQIEQKELPANFPGFQSGGAPALPPAGFQPPGGFQPPSFPRIQSAPPAVPTSKVIELLASFFYLDRVFGAVGL